MQQLIVTPFLPLRPDFMVPDECAVCGKATSKKCSRCKFVRYCSGQCQISDWNSHKLRCKEFKASLLGNMIALRPQSNARQEVFPYQQFVQYFNWDRPTISAPCGLINCGNTCFANVVLQCLAWTRPLVAYLLERGHKRDCRRDSDNWCFFCEFQTHVERVYQSRFPFSPMNIISRLPSIGGNLEHGRQEDAHELMRFAIDMMQSVCLEEFREETTIIQYIFGGLLQSQVQCSNCNNVSNQYENMMDLTVEIHGDAVSSLEECLDQFTAQEWLQGDNMYKCDTCNDYVKACKRLSIRSAPNILTIALKRFQSGRYGKLNKRISFPETLELGPYMSKGGGDQGSDVYKLYAVVVHLDKFNASFFGHYICYVKDFRGNWYRVDDSEVEKVELDHVLSQCAYMLLYTRDQARTSSLLRSEEIKDEKKTDNLNTESSQDGPVDTVSSSLCNGIIPHSQHSECEKETERDPGTDFEEEAANGKEDQTIENLAVDSSCSDITTLSPLDDATESRKRRCKPQEEWVLRQYFPWLFKSARRRRLSTVFAFYLLLGINFIKYLS